MKKIMTFMAAAMLVAAPAFFTSCDDDDYWDEPWYYDQYGYDGPWWYGYDNGGYNWNDNYYNNGGYNDNTGTTVLDEAEVLTGEWDGTMDYTNGDDGSVSSFYANMTFVRNSTNAIKGTGTEVDYTLDNNRNVSDQQTLKFNWYIDEQTGDIHIHYLTQSNTTFIMDASANQHGFRLDEASGTFSGYMLGTNNKDMIFINLSRVQNNEAKKATRATATKSFGSSSVTPVAGGAARLTNRR